MISLQGMAYERLYRNKHSFCLIFVGPVEWRVDSYTSAMLCSSTMGVEAVANDHGIIIYLYKASGFNVIYANLVILAASVTCCW